MSEWLCIDCGGTGLTRSTSHCPCCHGLGYHGGAHDCNPEKNIIMPSEPKPKTADEIINGDLGLKMIDLVTDAVASRLEEHITRRVEHSLLARIQELELKVEAARIAHEKDLEDVRSVIGLVSLDVDKIARESSPDRRAPRVTIKPEMLDLCTCGKPRGALVHLEGARNGHVFDYFQTVTTCVDDPTTASLARRAARLGELEADRERRERQLADMIKVTEQQAREITSLREQLRVADADRIPLAMDLEIANAEIGKLQAERDFAREQVTRLYPVVKLVAQIVSWYPSAGNQPDPTWLVRRFEELRECEHAYEKACADVANAEADDPIPVGSGG